MTLLEWCSVQTAADRWILIGFRMEQKKVKRFVTIFAEQGRQLVKSLVQRIEVSADKRIRIVFGFQDVFADLGKESAEK